jgi:hypothetical protein
VFRDDRVASALNHCDTNVLHESDYDDNQGQNRAFWRLDLCMEIPEDRHSLGAQHELFVS